MQTIEKYSSKHQRIHEHDNVGDRCVEDVSDALRVLCAQYGYEELYLNDFKGEVKGED